MQNTGLLLINLKKTINMLKPEALYLKSITSGLKRMKILNLCSDSEDDLRRYEPYCLTELILPLKKHNRLQNLDIKAGKGVDIVCDCQDMKKSIKNKSYDIVFFFNAIEHLLKPSMAVKEIHRVLKDGGICYASAPAENYPYHEDPIDTMLRMSSLGDWRRFFTEDKWNITIFKLLKVFRNQYNRIDGVTIIKAIKQ